MLGAAYQYGLGYCEGDGQMTRPAIGWRRRSYGRECRPGISQARGAIISRFEALLHLIDDTAFVARCA